MSDFFDTSAQADLDLLHSSVRNNAELDNVVDKVEWQIIDYFSQREGTYRTTYSDFYQYEDGNDPLNEILVRLVGYDQDTPTNSLADLQEALRRTIAEVVSYVLRKYDRQSGVSSVQQGKRSISYMQAATDPNSWPDSWKSRLKNFDAKVPTYGI